MGSLGKKLISGIVWIIISVGIGFWGTTLSESSGFVGILGWIISFIGFGFAIMSASHLFKLVSYHKKGVKMKEENPEAFEKLRKKYEEASRSSQHKEKED